jgi:glycosyltransferase involved in cell wall biosynthesis
MENNITQKRISRPVVSIVTISYNQEKYIAQAIDSFLMQQTNFDFEVIIADDNSRDKTSAIICEYAKKYPHIIKPILRKKNIGVQLNFIDALKHAQGDFIAICEGDDYWTDPTKLQRQVDFLSKNSDYSMCFHLVKVFFEAGEEEDVIYPFRTDGFTTESLLKENFIQTNSVMYRRKQYDTLVSEIMPFDWYLHLFHAQFGKIGFINRDMSSYRRHAGGVWWMAYLDQAASWRKHGLAYINLQNELLTIYGSNPVYEKIINSKIYDTINGILEDTSGLSDDIHEMILSKYPQLYIGQTKQLYANYKRTVAALDESLHKANHVNRLEYENERKNKELNKAKMKLERIEASLTWKMRGKILNLIGKVET